jgi:hypothetical protein
MGNDNTPFDGQDAPLEMDQSAAHRQFVASVVVALVIMGVAAAMAIRPGHQTTPGAGPHELAGVRQPTFVTPSGHFIAAIRRRETELP